jgi:hypothetical protein
MQSNKTLKYGIIPTVDICGGFFYWIIPTKKFIYVSRGIKVNELKEDDGWGVSGVFGSCRD